jgi:DNA-directed RNA polymerase subunit A'
MFMLLKKIKEIEFGFLSPEQIRKMSALEVKNPETYDKDGYPMESGLMDPHLGVINPGLRCKTCGQKMKQCPGHFGSLELVRPVIHSEFGKKIEDLLHLTCQQCGRMLVPDDKLEVFRKAAKGNTVDLTKRYLLKAKKTKKCPHCSAPKGQILLDKPTNFYLEKERIYPTQIREWLEKIPEKDLNLLGYNINRIRPEWFVLTTLQVPPITIRPSITLETGIKSEDDLTHKLVDIIRINLRLKDNIDAGAPQLIIEDLWDLLQYHVTTYFDNNTAGVPPAKHRSGRALRTLVQRLKGKKGRFRYNLTGKRVNFAARSTITPDSYLSINQVGVPEEIARDLTVPESVTELNLKAVKDLVKKSGKVKYIIRPDGMRRKFVEEMKSEIIEELDVGYKVERELADGDIVLFNRQPSLHRLSMMAHEVKVMPGKTLRMNPITCKPYNADFDGDEMNLHVPQTEEGKTEARELMFVQNQIVSPRYGGPVIILDEDGVSGVYILTMKQTEFGKDEAMKILFEFGFSDLPAPDRGKNYSGKLLFSSLLPDNLNLAYPTKTCKFLKKTGHCKGDCQKEACPFDAFLKIENGKLVSGVVDSASLGEGRGELVNTLAQKHSPEIAREFYDRLSRVAGTLCTLKGMTTGLDEYTPSDSVNRVKAKAVEEAMEEAEKLEAQWKRGTVELIPGRTFRESYEIRMMRIGFQSKDQVERQLLKEKVDEVVNSDSPPMNTTVMILSGSRGNPTNLTNIAGFWGQASVREGRPKKGFTDRLITLNKKKDVGVMAGGFIKHSFIEGLDAKEFFYHSMGGRQGEVDTGVSTKISGYLYRRLANSLKDLKVANDKTVRTASQNVVQFVYGEDGVFPTKTFMGKLMALDEELAKLGKASEKK